MMTFADLVKIMQGKPVQLSRPAQPVRHLMTDSRQGIFNESSVFFAIPGVRHDGHRYIQRLYAQGIRQFVVEYALPFSLPDANIVEVQRSIQALQQVVAHHRQQFTLPVVGITGSNGKTIVKEWLAQLLSPFLHVVKNPKSYNSQIGVPLSVWLLQENHEVGIFEAGISQPGEMEKLLDIIRPTVGIFTNIGPAHDEGFSSRQQKIEEKAILFRHCQTIIYCADDADIDQTLRTNYPDKTLYTWSTQPAERVPLQRLHAHTEGQGTRLALQEAGQETQFSIYVPFQDEASLENVMHCIAYMFQAGFEVGAIQKGIQGLRKISMRMELKQGINHCYLLDDSYSNDLLGLQMALDFLQQQKQNEKRTVILSDLLQTGQSEETLYSEVRQILSNKGVQKLIGIGPQLCRHQSVFQSQEKLQFSVYPDTSSFLQQADLSTFRHENILIKGARTFGFEHIVRRLQQKIHGTTLEINLDALTHNLNIYRSKLPADTKLMVMVKAFSYGGAAFEIASLLQYHQVDYLAVAYVDEGITLRENGIRTPILVLNPSPDSLEKMAAFHLEPEIYSLQMLQHFVEESKDWKVIPSVHLKIDTGMHRLGFEGEALAHLITALQRNPQIHVASIFSHLAASDERKQDDFTHQQAALFSQAYQPLTEVLGYRPLRHILNSAGILRFPEYHWEMVRLGIGLYGIDPNQQVSQQLRPISTLKTVISQIKQIRKGDTIGYSRRGVAHTDTTMATIAIGYADGFDRGFSNGNLQVWVQGKPASVIGNVCMDMTMIDITGIEAQEGDEVIIFGELQSVQTLADRINTIPYEILTNIGERVKRVFYTDS